VAGCATAAVVDHTAETPAAIPTTSSGTARILTERAASWDIRTGRHLPPRRPAGPASPLTGTAGPPASMKQPQEGRTPARSPECDSLHSQMQCDDHSVALCNQLAAHHNHRTYFSSLSTPTEIMDVN
jgi:hypothetical protein